jgi:probable F420-dependent oxidoreductase
MPIVDLARAAAERGFSGIFLNEHTHIPIDHPTSRFLGGGPTPARYGRFWDPFIALAFVAAATDLEIGTSISLAAEHDAIALAKAVATLDVLSRGRFVFGVGWGWNREEFADHGFAANERAQVLEEKVRLMRELWTQDVAEFRGKYVTLSPSWSWPKPHQKPHPPVLLGVPLNERNVERVVAYADGCMPLKARLLGDDLGPQLAYLRRRWEAAGRDPASLRITVTEMPTSRDRYREAFDRAQSLGVERVIIHLKDESEGEVLPMLDEAAAALP